MSRSFDGTNDNIIFSSASIDLSNVNPYTAAIWVFAIGSNQAQRVFHIRDSGGNGIQIIWNLDTGANHYAGSTLDGGVGRKMKGTAALNTWHFVAIRVNGGSGSSTMQDIIIDGVASTTAAATGTAQGSANEIRIGERTDGLADFTGLCAYAHIYNRHISLSECSQIMRFPGSIINGLVFFAPLWGASSLEPDYSGNAHHGTVTGAIAGTTNPPINGIYRPKLPNLYYSSFSSAAPPASTATRSTLMMLMGVS